MNGTEFLPTRASLLSRLKNPDDQRSWSDFCLVYRNLIHRSATRAGLSHAEADDVVQETFIIVARKIPEFRYDPARGSFKSWIAVITRRRIEKQLRKRLPHARGADPDRTSTLNRIPAPEVMELGWDAEWEKTLWTAGLERLRVRLKPKQLQMFDLYAVKEWPITEVARALGVSVTHVYVNKHRVTMALRREISLLKKLWSL